MSEQRTTFRRVLQAQAQGEMDQARALAAGLEDYALYPYFRYEDLRLRLRTLPQAEVEQFLTTYADSLLATQLRTAWLRELARAEQWANFVHFWQAQTDEELICQHFVARWRSDHRTGLFEDVKAVWLSPDLHAAACDEPFEHLYASASMNDALIWQRVRALMRVGESSRARSTATHFKAGGYRTLFERWLRAASDPGAVLNDNNWADGAAARDIVVYAVGHLARQDVDAARAAWDTQRAHSDFSDNERAVVARALAVAAADSGHVARIALLDAVPDSHVDVDLQRYRLREAIAAQAWPELARWTTGAPLAADEALRWRYWHAQALAALGKKEEAQALLHTLADERDYYGFLAADKLGIDYQLHYVPLLATAEERASLAARPGIVRAYEFDQLALHLQSRLEWGFELKKFARRELEIAAVLAAEWDWADRAILALGEAASYDDLGLRFPLAFSATARTEAMRTGLDPARVLAIIRIESAFRADARSPAGALGLMQLMPATARETAPSIGRSLGDPMALTEPPMNIALGTTYLQHMIDRFHGNFAMAAAAYNAGPRRVWQWQATECVAAERWIEMIPFSETRGYVRRVIFSAAIYQWRLQQPIMKLDKVLTPIPPRDTTGAAACTP